MRPQLSKCLTCLVDRVPHYVFIGTELCRTQSTKMLNDLCTRVTTDFLLSIGQQLLSIEEQSIQESDRLLHLVIHDGNYTSIEFKITICQLSLQFLFLQCSTHLTQKINCLVCNGTNV